MITRRIDDGLCEKKKIDILRRPPRHERIGMYASRFANFSPAWLIRMSQQQSQLLSNRNKTGSLSSKKSMQALQRIFTNCRWGRTTRRSPVSQGLRFENLEPKQLLAADLFDQLVAYYPLNGDFQDISQINPDGYSVDTQFSIDRFGREGFALELMGRTDSQAFFELTNDVFSQTSDSTVSFWVNVHSLASQYNVIGGSFDEDGANDCGKYGFMRK